MEFCENFLFKYIFDRVSLHFENIYLSQIVSIIVTEDIRLPLRNVIYMTNAGICRATGTLLCTLRLRKFV